MLKNCKLKGYRSRPTAEIFIMIDGNSSGVPEVVLRDLLRMELMHADVDI
jgi:hypothetical protein